MASTLYISLPSRVAAQHQTDWASFVLPFAIITDEGQLLQQGQQTMPQLKTTSSGIRQLVLLFAASDVSLLSAAVPPMSAAKLKTALPNLFEEQMLGDPSDAVLVAGPVVDGIAQAAVADRNWLETVAGMVKDWPVKKIAAYPAQLAMRLPEYGTVSAYVELRDALFSVTIRQGQNQGIGFNLDDKASVLHMLQMMAPEMPVQLHVPKSEVSGFQAVLDQQVATSVIELSELDWPFKVASVTPLTLDLMGGISSAHKPAIDWMQWRWTIRLLAAICLINIAALNFEWFRLKREARNLNESILQTYKTTYPKDTTILSPLEQMQQKVNASRRFAGQFAPNDFAVIVSQFTQAWDKVMQGKPANIASVEYKDHGLQIKLKSVSMVPMDELRKALADQSMKMESTPDGMLRVSTGAKK